MDDMDPFHESSRRAVVLVVIGCGGGAGASTLVAGLAGAVRRSGRSVAALDLDSRGGGLDVLFGVEHQDGVRWGQVAGSRGELDGAALLVALPTSDGATVLSHGRCGAVVPDHVLAACIDALRSVCDVVLVDAPRAVDPESLPADAGFVVVAHGAVRGSAAAGSVTEALRSAGREPVVVLRDGPEGLAAELADALSVHVVGRVGSERRVEHDVDRGDLPGSRGELARTCEELLDTLLSRSEQVAA